MPDFYERTLTVINRLEAERDRYRAVLERIKAKGCTVYDSMSWCKNCMDCLPDEPETWCPACIATKALEGEEGAKGE